ncbi:MAG TPA: 50S ribosomal protein L15 [Bacilli bacterium]|nr:50S ribosomal protein L15 [Bacilli bacterium]
MKLNELVYNDGARSKRTRRGRGPGSGLGKNGGTGNKGQNSRGSKSYTRLGFEGGQNPLFRRLPKRGFHNAGTTYAIVNLVDLNRFADGATITPTELVEAGLVKKEFDGVKVLGNGKIEKKLTVKANKFSASAEAAIKAAGGSTEVI